MQSNGSINGAFKIKNVGLNEYLYASGSLLCEPDKRVILTWKSKDKPPPNHSDIWLLEHYKNDTLRRIRNKLYDELLYADESLCPEERNNNSSMREVFTSKRDFVRSNVTTGADEWQFTKTAEGFYQIINSDGMFLYGVKEGKGLIDHFGRSVWTYEKYDHKYTSKDAQHWQIERCEIKDLEEKEEPADPRHLLGLISLLTIAPVCLCIIFHKRLVSVSFYK